MTKNTEGWRFIFLRVLIYLLIVLAAGLVIWFIVSLHTELNQPLEIYVWDNFQETPGYSGYCWYHITDYRGNYNVLKEKVGAVCDSRSRNMGSCTNTACDMSGVEKIDRYNMVWTGHYYTMEQVVGGY